MHSVQPNTLSHKQISDRYHYHLERAGIQSKEHSLLPSVRQGDRSIATTSPLPIVIYLDNLRSAHNVGSIFRTTEALAVGSIALSSSTPTPENKKVKDAAMGADQWVEWNHADALEQLPTPLIALETAEHATPSSHFQFPPQFTLALGNEEYGCSDAVLKKADTVLQIPMRGRKNSINVANAFSIVAAQIDHQFREE